MELLSSPVIALAVSYLVGSIPAGLLLTRWAGLGDLRNVGSGNIGATNALRAGGKKLGLATLALDIGKGIAGVLIVYHLTHKIELAHYGLLAAMVGHCFPVWLKFKGGKGVATSIGALIAVYHILLPTPVYLVILPLAAIWIGLFATTRYVSVASLSGALAFPVVTALTVEPSLADALVAALVGAKHHSNIRNLIAGAEHRFSFNKRSQEAS